MTAVPANTTIRHLQQFHRALDGEKGFDQDLLRNVALLSGEIAQHLAALGRGGELVCAIQDLRRSDGSTAEQVLAARIGEELADILAYVLKLANYAGVDLEHAYLQKMEANVNRTWHKANDRV